MPKPFQCSALLCALLLLAGCSATPSPPGTQAPQLSETAAALLASPSATRERIYRQHRQWQGTRYRLGGLSRSGIDCSGLVYTTFQQQFGLTLPRTTEQQLGLGQRVSRSQLRPGDLVFFKTGFGSRHVGIYIEDNRFLHASTSQGVTISSLDNLYWNDKYWQARRL